MKDLVFLAIIYLLFLTVLNFGIIFYCEGDLDLVEMQVQVI